MLFVAVAIAANIVEIKNWGMSMWQSLLLSRYIMNKDTIVVPAVIWLAETIEIAAVDCFSNPAVRAVFLHSC